MARDLRSASARVASLEKRLAGSLGREEELRGLLRLAHEQVERSDEELHAFGLRFHADLRRQTADRDEIEARLREVTDHRDELESRIIRLRRSLPGRVFVALQAVASIWRR
jgi:chromosome segregation ATPase